MNHQKKGDSTAGVSTLRGGYRAVDDFAGSRSNSPPAQAPPVLVLAGEAIGLKLMNHNSPWPAQPSLSRAALKIFFYAGMPDDFGLRKPDDSTSLAIREILDGCTQPLSWDDIVRCCRATRLLKAYAPNPPQERANQAGLYCADGVPGSWRSSGDEGCGFNLASLY